MGVPGVSRHERNGSHLRGRHGIGLERKKRRTGHRDHLAKETDLAADRHTRSEALTQTLGAHAAHDATE